MRALRWLADLIYPPKCIFCRRLLDRQQTDLCADCRAKQPRVDRPLRRGEFFEHCHAVYYYEDQVAEALRRFKFSGCSGYARPFGQLLAMQLLQAQERFDLICWVPVSRRRLRRRGYDQAELLARAVAAQLGCPVERCLKKTRENKVQSRQKSAQARKVNVLGVYAPVEPERFAGKRLLLIDDILTTGATMSECSRVLRTAGAGSVVAGAVAAVRKSEKNSR